MKTTSYVNVLASFLPWFQLERLQTRGTSLPSFRVEGSAGAVLFVDITGFSRITEQLSQAGSAGAEQLADILDAYFGRITEIIFEHGGDVLSFAGDAALGIWLNETSDPGKVTCLAAQAGLAVQRQLEDYTAMPNVTLQQRVSIGAGRLHVSELGGVESRWKLLVTGEAIEQAGAANAHTQPGEVVLSPAAWEMVQGRCQGAITDAGVLRLEAVQDPYALCSREPPATDQELADLIGSYLPPVVHDRVGAGQTQWLNEFRTISLAFVGLGALDFDNPESVAVAQDAVAATQRVAHQYEGVFHRLLMDDKGTSLILCFGMPPQAHEDDALRVVRAGLDLQQRLVDVGLQPSIGVTTGRAFCGACGGKRRRQYSIYGPVINLAARLMQIADGRLLCDANTAEAVGNSTHFEFVEQTPISLKGIADKVAVHQVLARDESQSLPESQAEIVGRSRERALLDESITRLVNDGTGGIVILEGEAGIGKSHLLNYAMHRAGQLGAANLCAAGDEIEKETPFYAWRPVFQTVLGVQASGNVDQNRHRLLRDLERMPKWLPMASLLNLLLPFDLPESELVGAMSEETRAETRQELLLTLLTEWSTIAPTLIAVENAQWLDSSSRKFLERLARTGNCLLLIATRPIEDRGPDHDRLLANRAATHVRLEAMEPDEVVRMVCQRLEVESLPLAVSELIAARGGGHPFFSEELAFMLRDVGLIRVANGKCRLVAGQDETGRELGHRLDEQDLPSTVQGVILQRLDELPPSQLLTVKVASTLGQSFPFEALRKVYPVAIEKTQLEEDLAELGRRDILTREQDSPDQVCRFKQAITVDVAYESMLFAQRRELHQAIAEWYEQEYSSELPRHYYVLAHHWQRAEVYPKAIEFLSKAGEQALSSYANREAVRFFSDAIKLDAQHDGEIRGFEPGTAELRMGRAFVNWARWADGRTHLEKGLNLSGEPVPQGWRVPFKFGGQLVRQVLHRTMNRRVDKHPVDADQLREAARAYEALMEIYYIESATAKSLYACLRSLNLAETAGPSPELARGYGAMGALVGMVGMRKSADRYGTRALNAAREAQDPAAEAWVALASGVYQAGQGAWDKAVPLLENAADISQRLNDRRRWADATTHLASAQFIQGDYSGSLTLLETLHDSAVHVADDQGRANALMMRGGCLLRLHQMEAIPEIIEEMEALREIHHDLKDELETLLAAVHLRNDNFQAASEDAKRALDQISEPALTYTAQWQYATLADVFLGLLEAQPESRSELETLAAKGCGWARKHARFFPVARASAAVCEGRWLWHSGRHARAHRTWRKGLVHARTYGLLFEEGSAHYQIGRHLDVDHPKRSRHLHQACELFERIGAVFDRDRAAQENPESLE